MIEYCLHCFLIALFSGILADSVGFFNIKFWILSILFVLIIYTYHMMVVVKDDDEDEIK